MPNDNIIFSDAPFTEGQRLNFASLLDMMIPPSEDGRMPGASELDILGYIQSQANDFIAVLDEGLTSLDDMANKKYDKNFYALPDADRQALVDEIKTLQPAFIQGLVFQTVACYYQNDRVVQALGLEARPPYPKGYTVEAGDMSLLDPVRQRSKLYRE